MAYDKQTWENEPSTASPLSATRLNHMEDGIADAHGLVDELAGDIATKPRVLVYDEGWPDRPDDDIPTIFVGGVDPEDAPDDEDLRDGDVWVPENGGVDGGGGGPVPDELTDLDTSVTGSELDAMKLKLDGIEEGADVTDATNVAAAGAFMKASDDLDDISEGATNKHFTGTLKTKLDGIEAGADVTDATNVAAAGAFMKSSDDLDDISEGSTNKHFTSTLKSKLDGIEEGAQVNVVEDLGDLGVTATASELNILDGATLSTTELNYVDGVTSSIQNQLNNKYGAGGTDVALADGGTGASLTDPNADRIMFWDDSAGAVTWLAPGTNLTISGTTIDVGSAVYRSGGTDVALADGGTGASLSDPNADRIMFWDDSAGTVAWLVPNTGLAISGTNLNVSDVPMSAIGTGKVQGSSNGTPTTLTLWKGTQAQYNAIGSKDSNTVYVVTES